MKIKGTSIGIILLLCFLTACQNNEKDYAALIEGEYEITKQQLNQHYGAGYFGLRFPDSQYKGYGKALDELVTRKLKQIDFINLGLHENEELMSNIQRVISEELLVRYFDTEYLGQYITDEVINDYYQGLSKEVSYQQIVLGKGNNEDLQSIRQKAEEIKQTAENNNNFTRLVKEYSEDPRSVQNDGKMPVMTWRESTTSRKNQVIFRMPEGAIRVLETPSNFLIVKVNKVNEVELRPLEEIKPEIERNLREVYSPRAYKDYDRDKANLLNKKEYEWNTEGLEQLVKWARIEGFYRQNKYKQIIGDSLANGYNFEILNYQNGTVDLQRYFHLLNNILIIETSANPSKDDFKEFIDEALRTELIVENAKKIGLDQDILSLNTKSPVILDEYVRLYNNEFILSRIPEITKETYLEFYQKTKDSLFYQPDKVNLRYKVFDSEQEAEEVINKIHNGIKFEDLFTSWSVKTYIQNKEGNIKTYPSNEPDYFSEDVFKLSQGEVVGPISFEQDGNTKFAVIKAQNIIEEKILKPDDIHKQKRERMFRKYYFNKFSTEVNKKLRGKYKVDINEKALAQLSGSN